MTKTDCLREKIKMHQDKLNSYIDSGNQDVLSWEKTVEMSKELDKLIVEFIKSKANNE